MADKNKVFDVSKPGDSAPETGSKPMVVGHKMMKDTSVVEKSEENSEPTQPALTNKSKTIAPITGNEESNDSIAETNIEEVASLEETNKVNDGGSETTAEPFNTTEPNADEQAVDKTEEEKNKEDIEFSVEKNENLQKIIKDKTYNVHIDGSSYSAFKKFILTFVIVVIISTIIIAGLIDANIIDLGVTLPFNIL